MVQVARLSVTASSDVIQEVMDRDGAVILEGLLSVTEYARMRHELDPHFEAAEFCQGAFFGGQTKRIHSLVAKSPICRELIMRPVIIDLMNKIMGPYCDKIQLNLTQGIQIWPGEPAQFLHRDDSVYPSKTKFCEFMVNAMWAYTEFTKDNGATVVVPGSHKWEDRSRTPVQNEITQADMRPGEVLVYLGSLIHGGGANRSKAPRTGMVVSYCLGWLRQYENQYLAVPASIARELPKELQMLLGYCVHRPNMGLYEGNDPSLVFDSTSRQITKDFLTQEHQEIIETYSRMQKMAS